MRWVGRKPASGPIDPRAAGIGPMAFDGWIVTATALAFGLDLVIYPRQIVATAEEELQAMRSTRMAFVHGVPSSSTLAAVTYAQDKRIRRALFEAADIPMPTGATFSYHSNRDVKRYVERIGFPVVVKEAVGENLVERYAGIRDVAELERVVKRLRERQGARTHSASNLQRSAYAMTGLREVDEDDETGQRLAPVDTRYLIERDMPGEYFRFLVLDDAVVAILSFPKGATDEDGQPQAATLRNPAVPRRLRRGRVHHDYAAVARAAVGTIEGLQLAAVDIVITDPLRRPKPQNHWVVELSERPHLYALHTAAPRAAFDVARRIVQSEAAHAGRTLGHARRRVSVDVRFEGVSVAAAFAEQAAALAARHGLEARVANANASSATAVLHLSGAAQASALVIERAMAGGFERQYPRIAEVRACRG